MAVNYTVQEDSFSDEASSVVGPSAVTSEFIRVLDLDPSGKRFAAFPRPEIAEAKGNLHVSFLLNFFDELHRRLP